MGSIGRYIFGTTFGAFLLVLVSLTGAVWLTQALREVDLMTSQGQSILVFVGITSLVIPQLIMVIAPLALVVAVAHVLHKLSTDSEIIVMNGAGMRPWRLLQPFLAVTLVTSVMLAAISAYVAPESLRLLRRWLTEVRADLVSNIVQPGRFIPIESGLAFNIRERRPNGLLVGLMLDDRRDPKERVTILAERGELLKNGDGNFLILENGSIHRHELKERDPTIVLFDRYAFDLSRFSGGTQVVRYSLRERHLPQLIWPDPNDPQLKDQAGQIRSELHERIVAPIYPFAFVIIAVAFLGAARTTRQSSAWSITSVILNVLMLRLIGFACTVFAVRYPIAVAMQYLVLAGTITAGVYVILRGAIIEPPVVLTKMIEAGSEWLMRRIGAKARLAQ
jgi:lipopolysaccharide export system permease protein